MPKTLRVFKLNLKPALPDDSDWELREFGEMKCVFPAIWRSKIQFAEQMVPDLTPCSAKRKTKAKVFFFFFCGGK